MVSSDLMQQTYKQQRCMIHTRADWCMSFKDANIAPSRSLFLARYLVFLVLLKFRAAAVPFRSRRTFDENSFIFLWKQSLPSHPVMKFFCENFAFVIIFSFAERGKDQGQTSCSYHCPLLLFLVAWARLYSSLCLSVCLSVRNHFTFLCFFVLLNDF